jgi:predicted nuclease of predicted toxin-antitoxin system
MRLLFDQNLSPRLIGILLDLYPGSTHVRDNALESADDEAVWSHALRQGLAIVSKDSDFHQRSLLYGHPPKLIWIRRGNCATETIASILRDHQADMLQFEADAQASFLVLA